MAATLKCDTIQNASSSTANLTLDASGNATVGNTLVMGSSFKRNKIINGDMRVDQRNAGASVTYTNSVGYGIDRWRNVAIGTSLGFSVARSATAPAGSGFTNSLLATVTTAKNPSSTDQARINQYIEGFNVSDLDWGTANAKAVTLSFWVRASVTGTYCVSITNADSATRSYVATYSINASNTWEQKSITIPGDTSGTWTTANSVGMGVSFALGSGSGFNAPAASTWYGAEYQQTSAQTLWINNAGATFYITGVQLEVGSIATPYERQIYSNQLNECMRYYQILLPCGGQWYSTTNIQIYPIYPIAFRAAPSATLISGANGSVTIPATANYTVSAIGTNTSTTTSGVINLTTSTATSGNFGFATNTLVIGLSAEL